MIKEFVRKKIDGEWTANIPEVVLKGLLRQAKKAQAYEDTLKYIQFQLKNGGQGKQTRIIHAVDKALEDEFDE